MKSAEFSAYIIVVYLYLLWFLSWNLYKHNLMLKSGDCNDEIKQEQNQQINKNKVTDQYLPLSLFYWTIVWFSPLAWKKKQTKQNKTSFANTESIHHFHPSTLFHLSFTHPQFCSSTNPSINPSF